MATQDEKLDQALNHLIVINERQANMAKDVEFLVKSDQIQEKHIQKLNQTVYGESGKNGLNQKTSILWRAFLGAQAVLGLLVGAIYFFKDAILSLFQHQGGR